MLQEKQNFLKKLTTNPKQVFLFDAFGALGTTLLLFGVLAQFVPYFGMPKNVLYVLSGIAFCLFVYSLSCYQFIKSKWKPFLRILMISNTAYVLISVGLLIVHSAKITMLGWLYFMLEFIVIGCVVMIEYKTYSNQK